jgi:hypothetical protein
MAGEPAARQATAMRVVKESFLTSIVIKAEKETLGSDRALRSRCKLG